MRAGPTVKEHMGGSADSKGIETEIRALFRIFICQLKLQNSPLQIA